MKSLTNIVLGLALSTPCMPKILISDGVTMYPIEILLLFTFFFYTKAIRTTVQKYMLLIWLVILLSTILSFVNYINIGGLMRCIKEILYIPILYLAYKSKWLNFSHIAYIFTIAAIINILYLVLSGFSFLETNIWDKEMMASGLSNKYFDIRSMSLGTLETGAHGIWGNYCVLALCTSLIAFYLKQISKKYVYINILLVLINLSLSVSREALLSFSCVLIAYAILKMYQNGHLRINYKLGFSFILFMAVFIYIIVNFGENILMVQKIQYTLDSYSEDGSESNILLRINAWKVFFESLIRYPYMIATGYGYNLVNYSSFLDFAHVKYGDNFVELPESFFVELFCFGGVFCFYLGIKFWKSIFKIISSIRERSIRTISIGLFVGLLLVNIFSGASIISDLLYCQCFIFLGILMRERMCRL